MKVNSSICDFVVLFTLFLRFFLFLTEDLFKNGLGIKLRVNPLVQPTCTSAAATKTKILFTAKKWKNTSRMEF